LHAFKIRIQVFLYLTSSQPFSKGEGQEEVLSFGEDLGEVLIQQVKSNHMETILNLQQVSKTYKSGSRVLAVLDNVSFAVQAGSALSIVGPSGSGKTTLLGLCAGLDRSSSGNVELQHMQLEVLNEDQLASVRNKYVGFIFQNFQLMPTLTALENVMVPLELRGEKKVRARSMDLLDKVGLADRSHHYPAQLSGGEQQRVSIARAFANRPRILFADEPTGNLDAETSGKIVNLIFDLNKEAGTTLLLVTHNAELAARTQRIIHLKGGKIVADKPTTTTVSNI
jgi:putative ABC transport system ATP-binding protein